MYEGNNPIALHSREWLVDSLLSLMENTPYSGITVRDICKKADLSRQTFYNFFESKDAVIRFCIHQCYSEMMGSLAERMPIKLSDITKQLTETLYDNQRLMRLIVLHELGYLLEIELVSVMQIFAEQISTVSSGKLDSYATAFLSGAVVHMILYWFKDERPVTQEQLSELLCRILTGNYFQVQNEYLMREPSPEMIKNLSK